MKRTLRTSLSFLLVISLTAVFAGNGSAGILTQSDSRDWDSIFSAQVTDGEGTKGPGKSKETEVEPDVSEDQATGGDGNSGGGTARQHHIGQGTGGQGTEGSETSEGIELDPKLTENPLPGDGNLEDDTTTPVDTGSNDSAREQARAQVPEPGLLGLFGIGALAMAVAAGRRRPGR